MNEVSASAQRSPRRSTRRAGSASLDMPAARPCGLRGSARAPVKPSSREVGRHQPAAAACAVCSCLESAASRRNSHSPAACVPAEPKACSICAGVEAEQMAGRRPPRRACRRCRWCGRSCSASGRGTRRRGCRPRSRRPPRPAARARSRRAPAPRPARAGRRPSPGWNTEPLCTSSCSATCEAAALTIAAKHGLLVLRPIRISDGPSAGPIAAANAVDRLDRPRALAGQRRAEPVDEAGPRRGARPAAGMLSKRSCAAKSASVRCPWSIHAADRAWPRCSAAMSAALRSRARAGSPRCARRAPAPGPCAQSKPLLARRQQRRQSRRPAMPTSRQRSRAAAADAPRRRPCR